VGTTHLGCYEVALALAAVAGPKRRQNQVEWWWKERTNVGISNFKPEWEFNIITWCRSFNELRTNSLDNKTYQAHLLID